MKNQWNYPLIWKTFKILVALLVFLFVFNSHINLIAKYNQLIRIEEKLGKTAKMNKIN